MSTPIFLDSRDKPLPKFKEPHPDQGKDKKQPLIEEDLNMIEPNLPRFNSKKIMANKKISSTTDKITIALNTSDWMFTQAVALTGCPIDGYIIHADDAIYVNENGNAWSNENIRKYYQTFIGGHNYYNHEQEARKSYGFIVDARLRAVNAVYYVDLLIATSLKNTPNQYILDKICRNEISTLSMGCESSSCQCSRCGNISYDIQNEDLCSHMEYQLGSIYTDREGDNMVTAMIVSDVEKDGKKGYIDFYEESWVDSPACAGAVSAYRINLPANHEIFFEMPKAALDRPDIDRNGLKWWVDNKLVKIVR